MLTPETCYCLMIVFLASYMFLKSLDIFL